MTHLAERSGQSAPVRDDEKRIQELMSAFQELVTEALRSPERQPQVLDILNDAIRKFDKCDVGRDTDEGGVYTVELTPEQRAAFFPTPRPARREVSAEESQEARSWWDAELERGKGFRVAALSQVGPLLRPSEVADRLGVSRVTVNNKRNRGALLAIQVDDSQYLYPAFQFANSPEQGEKGVLRNFGEVLALLPYESSWQKARFFLESVPALGKRTPLDVLKHGDSATLERLYQIARSAAEMGS